MSTILLILALLLSALTGDDKPVKKFRYGQCKGTTKAGKPCKSGAKDKEGLCGPHSDQAYAILEKEGSKVEDKKRKGRWPGRYVIAGTGSRELQLANNEDKKAVFTWVIEYLTEMLAIYGKELRVISGLAEGFDKALAKAAIQLGIPLILVIPNKGYGAYYWGKPESRNGKQYKGSLTGRDNMAEFNWFVEHASHVFYVKEDVYKIKGSGVYLDLENKTASWKTGKGLVHSNFVRNQVMVDWSDEFLVYNSKSRGTSHCVDAIKAAGLPWKEYEVSNN